MYYVVHFDNGGFLRTDNAGPEDWKNMNATPVSMVLYNENGVGIREMKLIDANMMLSHLLHIVNRIKRIEKQFE